MPLAMIALDPQANDHPVHIVICIALSRGWIRGFKQHLWRNPKLRFDERCSSMAVPFLTRRRLGLIGLPMRMLRFCPYPEPMFGFLKAVTGLSCILPPRKADGTPVACGHPRFCLLRSRSLESLLRRIWAPARSPCGRSWLMFSKVGVWIQEGLAHGFAPQTVRVLKRQFAPQVPARIPSF